MPGFACSNQKKPSFQKEYILVEINMGEGKGERKKLTGWRQGKVKGQMVVEGQFKSGQGEEQKVTLPWQ